MNDYINVPPPTDENAPNLNSKGSRKTASLETITFADLAPRKFAPLIAAVDNFVVEGLTLFCGASKIGKSWLMLDLAISVSEGSPFLGRKTTQGNVLYLALEDSPARLQNRIRKIGLLPKANANLHFATRCPHNMSNGLLQDLENWIKKNVPARLIIIDTLQKIRGESKPGVNAYAADYQTMSELKDLADRYHVCILLVHHVSKLKNTDDPFDRISGSTGLMGAADTTILVSRERGAEDAKVQFTGRDVSGDDFMIRMAEGKWHTSNMNAAEYLEDKLYEASSIPGILCELMSQTIKPTLFVTIQNLKDLGIQRGLNEFAKSTNAISRDITELAPSILRRDGIVIVPKSTGSQRGINLSRSKK